MLGELKETIACDISLARAEIGYEPTTDLLGGHAGEHPVVRRARSRALMARTRAGHRRERVLRVDPGRPVPRARATRCACSTSTRRAADVESRGRPTCATSTRCARACDGVDVVLHNVAQVPLARDRALFWSVNVTGTANVLLAARDAGVAKVVHTSTSAIYGIPESNPVDEDTPARPLEAYGRAKLEAEVLCRRAADDGLDVSIVRPRTILGHGRLGLMAILFELVAEGAPVFVFDGGHNRYQLVHADDLADACIRAGDRPGARAYNIGATEFGTMRETLEAVCEAAGTGSRVRSIPSAPARLAMRARVGGGPGSVRAVPLAALRRVAVVRHHPRAGRARVDAPAQQRVHGDRVVPVVPRAPRRPRGGGAEPPPVAGAPGAGASAPEAAVACCACGPGVAGRRPHGRASRSSLLPGPGGQPRRAARDPARRRGRRPARHRTGTPSSTWP